jgi:hypothetical protein
MTNDDKLLLECYSKLKLLFNPDVPLMKDLRQRLEKPSLWRKRNDKRREEIPVKSS